MSTLAEHWDRLLSAALLGTDRRPPPAPPPGPLAALVDGGGRDGGPVPAVAPEPTDDATRLLEQVAALTAVRRAGLRPGPAPAALAACPTDHGRACPPAAGRRLAELLEGWPALVDEWLATLVAGGYRLPAEHVVTLLGRYRSDPRRRARVAEAAGPLAEWVTDLFPELLAPRRPGRMAGEEGGGFPALPPDLAPLVVAPAAELVDSLVTGLAGGRWNRRHRPLLIRLVCEVDPAVLAPLAAGLADGRAAGRADDRPVDLTDELAVLARTRLDMLAELAPPPGGPAGGAP